jgi:hypothetical protein
MAPAQKKSNPVQACGHSCSDALSVNQPVAEKADAYSESGDRGRNPAYVLLSILFVAVQSGGINKIIPLKTSHSHLLKLL